jgi:hypothetical protein
MNLPPSGQHLISYRLEVFQILCDGMNLFIYFLIQLKSWPVVDMTYVEYRTEAARMASQLESAVPHAFLDEVMKELTSLRCDF